MHSRHDEHGATAVEYAIMVAGIAAAIIALVIALGLLLPNGFQSVITGLS